jgi:uncharacterized protein YqfA (UPF0365 family)
MTELLTSRDFQIGVITGIAGVVGIYAVLALASPVLRPWLRAKASGVEVGVPRLIGMRLRGVDPNVVLEAYIRDQKRGGQHSLDIIEAVYLAFGNDVKRGADLLGLVEREVRKAGSGGAA